MATTPFELLESRGTFCQLVRSGAIEGKPDYEFAE